MAARHFARTDKGQEEIAQGRKNLRGKLRTVLFLIDPAKSAETIAQQITQLGAPADAIAQLLAEGYIVEVGPASAAPPMKRAPAATPDPSAGPATVSRGAGTVAPTPAALPSAPSPVAVGAVDEADNFRVAKSFMNDTIVDALGIRSFVFTLRLERCATRADLLALIPDYTDALLKKLDRNAVRALVERTRELLGAART